MSDSEREWTDCSSSEDPEETDEPLVEILEKLGYKCLPKQSTKEPWESKLFRYEVSTLDRMMCDEEVCNNMKRSFFFGMCHKCYKLPVEHDPPLKRCSRCQLTQYCSTDCQKEDWSSHKYLCKINAIKPGGKNIFGAAKEEVVNSVDWTKYCCRIMEYNAFALKRNLKKFEKNMFSFPRVCFVCKESDPGHLTDCKNCYSVAYCSEEHKQKDEENHKDVCYALYLAMECYKIVIDNGFLCCCLPVEIPEVFQSLQNEVILNKIPESDSDMIELHHLFICLMSDVISYPLSVIYALEKVAMKLGKHEQTISEVQELTLHLVGCRAEREILGIKKWEYFMHQLPALMKLRVIFVGPELWGNGGEHKNYRHEDKLKGCENCQKKGRQVLYEESQMLYHEYVKADYYTYPDVIVAFNSGFHCLDTWPKSLVEMTKDHTVPLIFTAFNKYEAENDLHAVEHASAVEILLDWSKNPFSSVYPERFLTPHESNDEIIGFSNSYITVVRGKKEKK